MNTNPELIDQADQMARPAKKVWLEPAILVERSLEARADDLPRMFPTPTGRLGPLDAPSGGGPCG